MKVIKLFDVSLFSCYFLCCSCLRVWGDTTQDCWRSSQLHIQGAATVRFEVKTGLDRNDVYTMKIIRHHKSGMF